MKEKILFWEVVFYYDMVFPCKQLPVQSYQMKHKNKGVKTVKMKTVERSQWLCSGVFIVKCEQVSHFALIVDFEQTNVCRFILKIQTLLKARSASSSAML